MLRGVEFDKDYTRGLKKHGINVMSTTMVQIQALKLLGVKSMVGLTYFRDDLNPKIG